MGQKCVWFFLEYATNYDELQATDQTKTPSKKKKKNTFPVFMKKIVPRGTKTFYWYYYTYCLDYIVQTPHIVDNINDFNAQLVTKATVNRYWVRGGGRKKQLQHHLDYYIKSQQ